MTEAGAPSVNSLSQMRRNRRKDTRQLAIMRATALDLVSGDVERLRELLRRKRAEFRALDAAADGDREQAA